MVACGGEHTLFLSQENDVYATGNNENGQLGLCTDECESQTTPKRMAYFVEKVISAISAGSKHSAALTVEGYLYTWGSNHRGQLSQADSNKKDACLMLSIPRIVENQLGKGICAVHCRYNQTFVSNAEKGTYTDTDSDVFKLWRTKLRKFEENNAVKSN